MTHDEAYALLLERAEKAAAAVNHAGRLLAEVQRQGVRPPDRMDGDGEVCLSWADPPGYWEGYTLCATPDGYLAWAGCWEQAKESPNAPAAVRWLKERLGGGG